MKLTKPPRKRSQSASSVATIVVAAAVAASAANAESRRIQVGTLTCSLSASIGLVVGSQRNVSCMFRGTSGEKLWGGRWRSWHLHRPYELMEVAPWPKSMISAEA